MFYKDNKKTQFIKTLKDSFTTDLENFQESLSVSSKKVLLLKELEKNKRQFFVKYGGLKTLDHSETKELSRNKRQNYYKLSSEDLKYTRSIWRDVTNNAVTILKKNSIF